jgi:hypothetical protein
VRMSSRKSNARYGPANRSAVLRFLSGPNAHPLLLANVTLRVS